MKKAYMTPIVNLESAQPTSLLCESIRSDVGIDNGGGSSSDSHAKEDDWDIWGAE